MFSYTLCWLGLYLICSSLSSNSASIEGKPKEKKNKINSSNLASSSTYTKPKELELIPNNESLSRNQTSTFFIFLSFRKTKNPNLLLPFWNLFASFSCNFGTQKTLTYCSHSEKWKSSYPSPLFSYLNSVDWRD